MNNVIPLNDGQYDALNAINRLFEGASTFTNTYGELRVAIQKELNEFEKIKNEGLNIEFEHYRKMGDLQSKHKQNMELINILNDNLKKAQEKGDIEMMRGLLDVLKHFWT